MDQSTFTSFKFQPFMYDVIDQLFFKRPTNIQKQVIPLIMEGKSVIGESATGSGKTHAYLLPLLNRLDASKEEVQLVITSPTRELATQIYDEIQTIKKLANKEADWSIRLLVGGTDRKQMQARLKTSPHIVVGTPGRILDLILSGHLSIYQADAFIIDEADLMFELGLLEQIDQLLIRAKKDIQIAAFSATIPKPLEILLKKYLDQPVYIQIDDGLTPKSLKHHFISLRHRQRADVIFELTKAFQPYLAIIFTNGQDEAKELAKTLNAKGIDVGLLHGGMSQRERRRMLKQIEQLRFQYIVATDLVSRGIDIPGVSHVINAQLPKEVNFYVHRVGRTARAGLEGTSISLYTEEDSALIHRLEQEQVLLTFSDIHNGELIRSKRRDIVKKSPQQKSPKRYSKSKERQKRHPSARRRKR